MWTKVMLGVCCLGAMLTGCESSHRETIRFSFEVRKVTIETVPSGATVYIVNGMDGSRTLLGTTPCTDQSVPVITSLKLNSVSPGTMQSMMTLVGMVQVSIEKAGYETYAGKLSTEAAGRTAVHTITLQATAPAPSPAPTSAPAQ